MRKIGWLKMAVAASVVISGVIVAAPAAPALADAPPPPPVINMSAVPSQDAAAVQNFETNAVSEVLTDHSLPASDANSVLAWGRDDVRAQEWSDLDKIISEDVSKRSSDDQAVYTWFQGVMLQQQLAGAKDAVKEYLKWSGRTASTEGSPPLNFTSDNTGYCNFEPPGGETGPFGGTYTDNQDQDCFTPCTDLLTDCTPAYPTVQQFEDWGTYDAEQAQTNTPDYYSAMVGTAVSMGVGLTAALGSVALPFGTAIDASSLAGTAIQAQLIPFAARVGIFSAQAVRLGLGTGTQLASQAVADGVPEAAAGAEVAGAVAFVVGIALFFIISTTLAIITLVQNADTHTQLDALTQTTDLPDLGNEASTSDGYGALYSSFIAQTLPEADLSCTSGQSLVQATLCANAPAIPVSASTDPSFLVTANGSTKLQRSIYSVDPFGYFDNTYMSGAGWFVTQRFDPTDSANATSPTNGGATLQSLSFPYTDWAGNHWIAERVTDNGQPMFAITPVDSSNGSACAIPQGGTTTPCLTTTLQFQEPNGINGTPIDATAELEPASASAPTASASYPATVQEGQLVNFSATGSDPNSLPLTYTWTLPRQTVNGNFTVCGTSTCSDTLTGASPSFTFTLPGVYAGTLTVTNSLNDSSTENFTVTVTDATTTSVSSSANPSAYGQPVTLTADVAPTLVGPNFANYYPPVVGQVQFMLDGSPYGQPVALQRPSGLVPDGVASITLPKPSVTPAGGHGHDITAQFLGTSTYTASSKFLGTDGQVVNPAATSTTVISSANPSVTGQPFTLTASVAPLAPAAGLPTGTVQFQFNGQDVGAPVSLDSTGTATYSLTPAHATQGGLFLIGFHSAEAVYSGDSNFASSSGGADQSVLTDPTTTTVTSSASPSSYRDPVTFTATVAAASPGGGTPTGQVQFSFDGNAVGSPVSLDANGVATLTTDSSDVLAQTGPWTGYPTGHAITAQYLSVPCPDPSFCLGYVPDFGQSTGTLSPAQAVEQAVLIVGASSAHVMYGDPSPAISPGYTGFVAGDTPASLTTAPACATAYQQGNGVGTYAATCSDAVDPAYEIIYAGGAVTVTPATLTVTAKDASMQAGGTQPGYGFTLSGFIGSDGPSALTTQPTCVADDPATGNPVSSATPAGTYPITCTCAAAANYGFTYISGTLTISRNATSVIYTGGQTVLAGSAFSAQALVSSPAAVCSSGQTVSFSLDRNPATGVTGSYPVGTASTAGSVAATTVATTGWQQGVYVITAAAQANGDCGGSTATATLTVGAAGKSASASGWYNVAGAGKVAFSLAASLVAHTSPPAYTGTFTLSDSQWQLTGTVSRYVLTGAGAGSVTGTGTLQWWNPSLNKGKGGWQVAKSGVSFTAIFAVNLAGAGRRSPAASASTSPTARSRRSPRCRTRRRSHWAAAASAHPKEGAWRLDKRPAGATPARIAQATASLRPRTPRR